MLIGQTERERDAGLAPGVKDEASGVSQDAPAAKFGCRHAVYRHHGDLLAGGKVKAAGDAAVMEDGLVFVEGQPHIFDGRGKLFQLPAPMRFRNGVAEDPVEEADHRLLVPRLVRADGPVVMGPWCARHTPALGTFFLPEILHVRLHPKIE